MKALNTQDVLNQIRAKWPMPTTRGHVWNQLKEEPEFFDLVIDAVSSGMSVQYFAESVGIPPGKVSIWMNRLEGEQKNRYEEARHSRAAMFAERILTILDEVKAGILTPPQGKVIVDNLRWLAKAHDQNMWGDKLQSRVEVVSTTEMHLLAVQELAERVIRRDPRPVIEGEVFESDESERIEVGPDALAEDERMEVVEKTLQELMK